MSLYSINSNHLRDSFDSSLNILYSLYTLYSLNTLNTLYILWTLLAKWFCYRIKLYSILKNLC
jgi:hypothetical protein